MEPQLVYEPSYPSIIAGRVNVPAAATAYQLPSIQVPKGMVLALKAAPTNGAGVIWIAGSSANVLSLETSWPLIANEAITYHVINADNIYYSGTIAGIFLHYTVEKEKR